MGKGIENGNQSDGRRNKELDACSALVVGGTAGIGLATACGLASAGVPRIAVMGRTPDRGEAAADVLSQLGADATFIAGNAVDPAAAARVAQRTEQALCGIDILVCSTAANVRPELFKDIPITDIALILSEVALPSMQMASPVIRTWGAVARRRRGSVVQRVRRGSIWSRSSRRS